MLKKPLHYWSFASMTLTGSALKRRTNVFNDGNLRVRAEVHPERAGGRVTCFEKGKSKEANIMADIKKTCPKCGRVTTISEYVSVEYITCAGCGEQVSTGKEGSELSELKKKPMRGEPPSPPSRKRKFKRSRGATPPPLALSSDLPATPKRKKQPKQKTPRAKKGAKAFLWQTGAFLLVGALLIGMQYFSGNREVMNWYTLLRWGIIPLIWIFSVLAAFQESRVQGFLCLVLPPYLIFYMLGQSDNYGVRGAFAALMVSLAAEMYFIPEQSVVTNTNEAVSNFVNGGQKMIKHAGESDIQKY
jgi:hypothetical protein